MVGSVFVTSDRSKQTAFWLCLFLGFFGAHYFYVGRIGRGIVSMLTANFFFFGWMVDLATIRAGRFLDNVGEPLRE